jgi:hypothetical protein
VNLIFEEKFVRQVLQKKLRLSPVPLKLTAFSFLGKRVEFHKWLYKLPPSQTEACTTILLNTSCNRSRIYHKSTRKRGHKTTKKRRVKCIAFLKNERQFFCSQFIVFAGQAYLKLNIATY